MPCAGNPRETCGGGWANSVCSVAALTGSSGGGPPTAPPPAIGGTPPGPAAAGGVSFPAPRIAGMQVDCCPTFATNCGQAGADLFCRTQDYPRAARWEWGDTHRTWVVGSGQACQSNHGCGGLRDVACVPLQ